MINKQRVREEIESIIMHSEYSWFEFKNNFYVKLPDQYKIKMLSSPVGFRVKAEGTSVDTIDSPKDLCFIDALEISDRWIRGLPFNDNWKLKNVKWRQKPASEKQIDLLKQKGISFDRNMTKGEAMNVISCVIMDENFERKEYPLEKKEIDEGELKKVFSEFEKKLDVEDHKGIDKIFSKILWRFKGSLNEKEVLIEDLDGYIDEVINLFCPIFIKVIMKVEKDDPKYEKCRITSKKILGSKMTKHITEFLL